MTPARIALLTRLMLQDPWRWQVLAAVRDLALPDWAIGAGFVRNAVWDHFSGFAQPTLLPDIDVLYFDDGDCTTAREQASEAALAAGVPGAPWSVKNQARMHRRNGDAPYCDTEDALRFWLETATCIAVRLEPSDSLTVIAPYGLDDLFALRSGPTPAGRRRWRDYSARMRAKNWPAQWPGVTVAGL